MDISIILVTKEEKEKEILRNLHEKYCYEFSQYNNKLDVNELGLYGYDDLDNCWTEENLFPYFMKIENKLAGFMIVNDSPINGLETEWTMADFFVMYKYRKMGIGTFAVRNVFEKHKGKWGLMYHPHNIVSKKFWNKVVNEYTKGKYELITEYKEAVYEDGTNAEVLIFKT